ncbi:hypothetical protein A8709_17360 [Paenibacillus pectinilyticus]|uniref:Uncharacterized protein n=2 Tax=Paenibacillus pectinilyticus TaxID=512399 RepID=A0A1C0ZZ17_9BACL|nr:hypothetical protein A8709_17360 [Paenibacillus pectinilyticus]
MTWNNFQSLGIKYSWSETEGLLIWTNKDIPPPIQSSPIVQDLTNKRNLGSYTASLTTDTISINNTTINNSTEPYPFLTYHDVTYMPLTWRFVHDLLHLDIKYSDANGLSLIGGQNIMYTIIGDDDSALYLNTAQYSDPAKAILRMDKSNYQLSWESQSDTDNLIQANANHPFGGKPIQLQRVGRDLLFNNIKLYSLTDEDVMEMGSWGAPVQTFTKFDAGDQGVIISINLTLQVAAIGPNYGRTFNFLIRNGLATELEFFHQKIDRVIPNPDGSVWIASDILPSRYGFMAGSARLGLLDQEGHVRMINDQLHESDVITLGISNPALPNPADKDGSLYIILNGISQQDFKEQGTAGLYMLNTNLQTERLSDHLFGQYYLDNQRHIFIKHPNNTIENYVTGEVRTWFDYELAQMK